MTLQFTLNQKPITVEIAPHQRLVDVLRENLGLTGTKEGCGVGECGACTVIVDGRAVNSCMMLAASAQGRAVTTIEGVEGEGGLDPIQEAFLRHHAIQCGFCTPGMVLSAKALLDRDPHPTREAIKEAISGNLCRCTGYEQIVAAIEDVAKGGGGGSV